MKKFFNAVTKYYLVAVNSIVFYPSLIAIFFFFFALFILYIEYTPFILDIKQKIEFVLVKGPDNARVILNNVIGGIISLTVFSFSMVMVVLSQASSSYSPRVLPGLITRKSHQVVLGFYLGTIVYSFMLVINLNPNADQPEVAALGILFCMIFGITSLALFVYFIHSISTAIQIDNVMNDIYEDTLKKIQRITSAEPISTEVPTLNGFIIKSRENGYFRELRETPLLKILSEKELIIQFPSAVGDFIIKGAPFIQVSKPVDENTQSAILDTCFVDTREVFGDHYLYGFKQLSEVAIKALSPGINDPGTALKAIDMICILLIEKMSRHDGEIVKDKKEQIRIQYVKIGLDRLIQDYLMPIHNYGKADTQITCQLFKTFHRLYQHCQSDAANKEVIIAIMKSMSKMADENIKNTIDRETVDRVLINFNKTFDQHLETLS